MQRLSIVFWLWLLLFACAAVLVRPAQADFLPIAPRAVSLGTSASRDAPVIELAYGPRPQGSIGGELGLYLYHGTQLDFRVSVYALIAIENGTSLVPDPLELYRLLFGVSFSLAMTPPSWLGGQGKLEFSLGIGREQAATLGGYVLPDPAPTNGIPFGGGGTFLEPDIALQVPRGKFDLILRLDDRVHLPAFLLLADQRVLANVVADSTSDALINQASADVVLRYDLTPRFRPLISAHGDLLTPLDASAKFGYFVRGLVGLSIKGKAGELIPFLSGDIGNGQGLLINRHEERLSGGIRYAVF